MIGISKAREVLMAGRPLLAQAALEAGLLSAVTSEADLDEAGLAMARDMLKAALDALRLSKRSMDASLEQPNFDAAVEAEERSQMLMIVRRGRE
jgi:enoyl-CoA hydratase